MGKLGPKAGTTSAYAENTQQLGITDRIQRNYLRVRGEYAHQLHYSRFKEELPPRTRRIHRRHDWWRDWCGTTSAYAENTHSPSRRQRAGRNYLRVRGEYAS